jgi:hypothetical protein
MSDPSQQSKPSESLPVKVILAFLGALIAYLLPIAFPATLLIARIVLAAIIVGGIAMIIWAFRKAIGTGTSGATGALFIFSADLIRSVQRHPRMAAACAVLALALGGIVLFVIWSQPVVAVEKEAESCPSISGPVSQLCHGRGADYVAVVIKVASGHPLADFPPATLTDSLSDRVGPTTLTDRVIVKGQPGSFSNSTAVKVPPNKWLQYTAGSTIEIRRGRQQPISIADTGSGQGQLFLGVSLRSVPRDFPWTRQPAIEFAYLLHFVDAPQAGQGPQLSTIVVNLSRGGADVSHGVQVGDRLRVQLELMNLARYPVWDAVASSKLPAVASDAQVISGILQSGLGTVTDVASVFLGRKAYLNYVPESTMVARSPDPPASLPDVGGVGPLFSPDGVGTALIPGADLHVYCYFDVRVQPRPDAPALPAFSLR